MAETRTWDDRYRSGETPWDTGHPSTELVRVVSDEKIPPGRAVELGCGTGTNALWLAAQGFDVTAVDISPLALARARAKAAGARVRFLEADVLRPPPELAGPFDFFFDRGCYHVVRRTDVAAYLQTVERITAPGAHGLVLAGNAREPHDPGPPVVREDEIRAEWGRSFDVIWLREFRFDQVEAVGVRFLGWSCFLRKRA